MAISLIGNKLLAQLFGQTQQGGQGPSVLDGNGSYPATPGIPGLPSSAPMPPLNGSGALSDPAMQDLLQRRAGLVPPALPDLPQRSYAPLAPYPTAPVAAPMPNRDFGKEAGNSAIVAGLLGGLATLTGNRDQGVNLMGSYLKSANNTRDVQYGNRVQQWESGQQQARQGYADTVNAWGQRRSDDLRQRAQDAQVDASMLNRYKLGTTQYNAEANRIDKEIATRQKSIDAATPKPDVLLKERNAVVDHLTSLTPDAQQQYAHVLAASGDWKRLFGEDAPAIDGTTGLYKLDYQKAAPPKAPVDANTAREKRVLGRIDDLNKRFNDLHTTDAGRQAIIAEIQSIKRARPDLYPGAVPKLSDYSPLTAMDKETIKQHAFANDLAKQGLKLRYQIAAMQKAGKSASDPAAKALAAQVKTHASQLVSMYNDIHTSPEDRANILENMKSLEHSRPGTFAYIPTAGAWDPATKTPTIIPGSPNTPYSAPSRANIPGKTGFAPPVRATRPSQVVPRSQAVPKVTLPKPIARKVAPGKYGTIIKIEKVNN